MDKAQTSCSRIWPLLVSCVKGHGEVQLGDHGREAAHPRSALPRSHGKQDAEVPAAGSEPCYC